MNINVTLIVQMVVFAILIWFTMKFVWPMILGAMDEREKKIAAGLAAAEKGQQELAQAQSRADDVIIRKPATARQQIIDQAQHRANEIIEQAKADRDAGRPAARGSRPAADRAREQPRAREPAQGSGAARGRAASKLLEREIDREGARGSDQQARNADLTHMADTTTIARPYAQAVFAAGAQRQAPRATGPTALTRGAVVVQDARVQRLLGNPHVTPRAARASSSSTSPGAQLDEHGRNFVQTLAENRRLGFLPEIAALFDELKDAKRRRRRRRR